VDALDAVVVLNHVADPHVLVSDDRMGAYESERRLVVKVRSLAAQLLLRLGEQSHRLTVAMAPFHPV
jgi:hypothetical protein